MLLSGPKLVEYELQTAARTMAEAKAETGTFEMTDMRQFKNLAVVFANDGRTASRSASAPTRCTTRPRGACEDGPLLDKGA